MSPTRPEIVATFVLDDNGKPKVTSSGQYRHYLVRLSVKDAPSDTHAVTYFLHPDYYDSSREARDRTSDFAEEFTSYGDYEIQAKVRSREQPLVVKRMLYEALAETHGVESPEPAIREALEDMRNNRL